MHKLPSQMEQPRKSTHELWVDFLRVTGTFLVVLAHVGVWGGGPKWAESLYYTISRTGVPLFFMISGYLLLPKEEDTLTFLKKRAWKILIPFFAWSIIYDVYVNQAMAQTGLTLEAVFRMFIRILRGPRAPHLWYLYALIGLYLFTPILRLFVAKARNSDVLYYILLWFLTMPILLIIQGLTPIHSGFELYYFSGYVGYFLLGLYIGRLETNRRTISMALTLFALGLITTFMVIHFDLLPKLNEAVFRTYLSLNVIVMATSAFYLLKSAGEKIPPRSYGMIDVVSQSSFGIYLMHWLIVGWMVLGWQAVGFDATTGSSIVLIPVAAVIAFLISLIITHFLRRIPILKTIVP
jgi:surface polysaccharide O-acyltransferase-like enzyme